MEEYPFADLLVHCRDGFHSIPAMDDVLTMLMIEMYLYYPMRKYKVYAWHEYRLHITCCGLFLFYSLYQLQMEQSLRQIPVPFAMWAVVMTTPLTKATLSSVSKQILSDK